MPAPDPSRGSKAGEPGEETDRNSMSSTERTNTERTELGSERTDVVTERPDGATERPDAGDTERAVTFASDVERGSKTEASRISAGVIELAFNQFESDGLDPPSITKALAELGLSMDVASATKVIKKYDTEKKGKIDRKQFSKVRASPSRGSCCAALIVPQTAACRL